MLAFVLTIGLSGYGLALNSSSKKEIDKYLATQLEALKPNQSNLKLSDSQPVSSTAPASGSTSNTAPATPKNNTGASSTPSSSSPVAVSDAAKQQATNDINYLQGMIESYWADNGYYPGDINYSTFASMDGANQSYFTPPSGVHFVYTATPSGCTTLAQNCTGFSVLAGYDSAGNAVTPIKKSLN